MKYRVLLCSFFLLAGGFANIEEAFAVTKMLGGGSGGSSGMGKRYSTRHVSTIRDVAKITYPGITKKKTKGSPRLKRILLVEPLRFDREGVYVWRNVEGIWNIRLVSDDEFLLSGNISTSGNLEFITENNEFFLLESSSEALIKQKSIPGKDMNPAQFKVTGPNVDFDISIDGKQDSSLIYLGIKGRNPKHIPFRLENRPIVATISNTVSRAKSTINADGTSSTATSGGGGGGRMINK